MKMSKTLRALIYWSHIPWFLERLVQSKSDPLYFVIVYDSSWNDEGYSEIFLLIELNHFWK